MKACTAIVNEKGGVGKSSVTINMAGLLAKTTKFKILTIDTDSQCNTTSTFLPEGTEPKYTIFDVFKEKCSVKEAIIKTDFGDLIPGDILLTSAESSTFISKMGPISFLMLKKAVDEVANDYDFIFIDTSPDSGLFTSNAILASTGVIIPVNADRFSMDGLVKIKKEIDDLNKFCNASIQIYGVLLNKVKLASNTNKEVVKTLPDNCKSVGLNCFNTFIRDCQAIADAINRKMTIMDYDSRSNGMKDMSDLVAEWAEIISR